MTSIKFKFSVTNTLGNLVYRIKTQVAVRCFIKKIVCCVLHWGFPIDEALNSNSGINLVNICSDPFLLAVTEVVLKDSNGSLNTFLMISEAFLSFLPDLLLGLFNGLVPEVSPPREELMTGFVIDPLVALLLNLGGNNISVLIDSFIYSIVDFVCVVVWKTILDIWPDRGLERNLAVRGHPVGLFVNLVNNLVGDGDHDVNVGDVRQYIVYSGIDGTRNNLVFVINDSAAGFLGNLTGNVGSGVLNVTANMGGGFFNFTANVLHVVNKAGVRSRSEGGGGKE
jgi:hypothetical protein